MKFKTILLSIISILNYSFHAWAAEETSKSIFRTDINAVLSGEDPLKHTPPLVLKSGLYELGGIRAGSDTTHYLLIKEDVNNTDNFLAIIFPKEIRAIEKIEGYILVGSPLNNGQEILMVNLIIDSQGNTSNESMYKERGAFIRVLKNDSETGREFFLHGSHPLLKGKNVWGMRSSIARTPRLLMAKTGVYGGDTRNPEALISAGEISFGGDSYAMIPINGTSGGIIGLTRSATNIMGGYSASGAEVERLLVFIKDFCDTDVILDIRPKLEWGQYEFRYIETSFGKGTYSSMNNAFVKLFKLK